MTKIIAFIFVSISLIGTAQEVNPFESIGKEGKMLTLSKGKYKEFHDNDSLQQIGSVIVNTNTGTIYELLDVDTLYSESTLDPTIISRWYSPDPLASEFPYLNPYNFVANSPIIYIDPDGRKIRPANNYARDVFVQKYVKYEKGLQITTGGNDVLGTSLVADNFKDFKSAMKKADVNYTKSEMNEAWVLYNGLKDPKIIEITLLVTAKPTQDNTSTFNDGTSGAVKGGQAPITSNSEYREFTNDILPKLPNGELNAEAAGVLYNGNSITIDNVEHTITPTEKGNGWVLFGDQSWEQKTYGHLVIDATDKNEVQITDKIVEAITKLANVKTE